MLSLIQALHKGVHTLEAGEMLVEGRSSATLESTLATVDCACTIVSSLVITFVPPLGVNLETQIVRSHN